MTVVKLTPSKDRHHIPSVAAGTFHRIMYLFDQFSTLGVLIPTGAVGKVLGLGTTLMGFCGWVV